MVLHLAALVTCYSLYCTAVNTRAESLYDDQLILIDSLKAENGFESEQLAYMLRYFGSTKHKIPPPRGYGFVADSISNK
ncbi:MAG: hypothetical protein ABI581_00505 [Sediminibacterium sp.]